MHKEFLFDLNILLLAISFSLGGGGGLPCGHDRVARRNCQNQPLKVTNMCVAPAYLDP